MINGNLRDDYVLVLKTLQPRINLANLIDISEGMSRFLWHEDKIYRKERTFSYVLPCIGLNLSLELSLKLHTPTLYVCDTTIVRLR